MKIKKEVKKSFMDSFEKMNDAKLNKIVGGDGSTPPPVVVVPDAAISPTHSNIKK
jgi:bacteriocin-like protein